LFRKEKWEETDQRKNGSTATKTVIDTIPGTPHLHCFSILRPYVTPELMRDDALKETSRIDVYAFGLIFP
jgi:hypothetical protein